MTSNKIKAIDGMTLVLLISSRGVARLRLCVLIR